jgi:hypothetical protein
VKYDEKRRIECHFRQEFQERRENITRRKQSYATRDQRGISAAHAGPGAEEGWRHIGFLRRFLRGLQVNADSLGILVNLFFRKMALSGLKTD